MIEMTRIWERLYIGSHRDAERLHYCNSSDIITVVSLCEKPIRLRRTHICYLQLPIDSRKQIEAGQFNAVVDAIAEVRWGALLLHCRNGISCAPVMAAAWMHLAGYKNIDDALFEIARLRPEISPSRLLLDSVKYHLRNAEIANQRI